MTPTAPEPPPSRRLFLKQATAAASLLGTSLPRREARGALEPEAKPGPSPKGKVIDCHGHLAHRSRPTWEKEDQALIDAADRLGINQLCCSLLTPKRPATPEGFRECNRWTLDAMKRFPGRVLGYAFVNPGYKDEALEDIKRCVGEGFIGIKMYNDFFATDPVVFPIVELAIELGVPILHHAGHLHYFLKEQPHISDGGHFAELAGRYPEARLICAHACGGGDWEWTIKALRHAPTVYLDTSGSVTDDGVIEFAVKTLGADRLVFGCDMSMTVGVGRIQGADLDATTKAKILGGNMEAILKGRKS
ncbi:amidohydrolase family protein [Singulisphaera acidiphila]|uniref:Putative TIM-barrel fold metal-dependent hydrolase n=1 Tax=Singulisphaera acidiphila (strain ATCC BAA-1392 / DSM 18658 / VKM B-2454 / MOB10) TaxID=886293 RepID=L0D6P7_SINAD|nr:amidohydrolase family protein [Singulisphaera acidiphila]AGA25084.1 putative TIM-barrel fold metal-dependent hydrolase [Singulisphaera acidiphila DSM 18658]